MTTITQDGNENRRPRFQISIETRLIYDMLRQTAYGDIVTYVSMSNKIGSDVRGDGRSAMTAARRIAERDNLAVFEVVPNVGLKRITDHENIASAGNGMAKIRRASRRLRHRIGAVNYGQLSDTDKILHNAHMSAAAATELFAAPKAITKITAAVDDVAAGELPIGKTLELFRS